VRDKSKRVMAKKLFNDFCRFSGLGDFRSPIESSPLDSFATPPKRRIGIPGPVTGGKKIKLDFSMSQ
jgi:hypothetical protein